MGRPHTTYFFLFITAIPRKLEGEMPMKEETRHPTGLSI